MPKEIERKFLVSGFPIISANLIEESIIMQGYVSTEPEFRIREKQSILARDGNVLYLKKNFLETKTYKMTLKTNGDMVRNEIELDIPKDFFLDTKEMIGKPFIEKIYRKYDLPDYYELEVSLVDKDTEHSFYYAEVEFDSEDEAEKFDIGLIPNLIKEITDDNNYKMKNYWIKTRGGN